MLEEQLNLINREDSIPSHLQQEQYMRQMNFERTKLHLFHRESGYRHSIDTFCHKNYKRIARTMLKEKQNIMNRENTTPNPPPQERSMEEMNETIQQRSAL